MPSKRPVIARRKPRLPIVARPARGAAPERAKPGTPSGAPTAGDIAPVLEPGAHRGLHRRAGERGGRRGEGGRDPRPARGHEPRRTRCASCAPCCDQQQRPRQAGPPAGRPRARRQLAGGRLPVQEPALAQELRAPEVPPAGRAAEAAGLGEGHRRSACVVLFEGRDAAGKGGTIRRFMEHLNPRGARVVALEKPTDRGARPVVLPALRRAPAHGGRDRPLRPQLVQPRGRRARDGLLHGGRVPGVHAPGARSSSACWCARASTSSSSGSR